MLRALMFMVNRVGKNEKQSESSVIYFLLIFFFCFSEVSYFDSMKFKYESFYILFWMYNEFVFCIFEFIGVEDKLLARNT